MPFTLVLGAQVREPLAHAEAIVGFTANLRAATLCEPAAVLPVQGLARARRPTALLAALGGNVSAAAHIDVRRAPTEALERQGAEVVGLACAHGRHEAARHACHGAKPRDALVRRKVECAAASDEPGAAMNPLLNCQAAHAASMS